MTRLSFILLFSLSLFTASGQLPQKLDSAFKTIFASELCDLLQQRQELIFIDVRSEGEYNDRSSSQNLNLGRIRGAINLDIDSIKKNPSLLEPFRNKNLVVYCSHSQRSRKVSKYLSDHGFQHFYNLNGGMSQLNQLTLQEFPCKNSLLVTSLPYYLLSNEGAAKLIKHHKNILIIDIRPEDQFNSHYKEADYNMGHIKNARNIPYASLSAHLIELEKFKNDSILIYGTSNQEAAKAALYFTVNGFRQVYLLIEGYYEFLASQSDSSFFEQLPGFHLLDATRTTELLIKKQPQFIFDTRPLAQFENRDTVKQFYNIGKIKGAQHVSLSDTVQLNLPNQLTDPVLLYGTEEAHLIANYLVHKGYSNVFVLTSLYDLVWSSANVENCKKSKEFLVNHRGLY